MTLLSLEKIVGCEGYYIDDKTLQIWSFKQDYKNGKLMKPHIKNNGYIDYGFCVNGKYKHILYHHIIVKIFIKKDFNSKIEEVDHKDRNPKNNSIENLCVVSRSENQRNMSRSRNGKEFNFINDIGKSLVINEEAGIYYSLDYNKFYMHIKHSDKYKELHVCLNKGIPYIKYRYNNKGYSFSVNKFKKSLNKK